MLEGKGNKMAASLAFSLFLENFCQKLQHYLLCELKEAKWEPTAYLTTIYICGPNGDQISNRLHNR
jgi:hypothetical protein